MGNWIVGLALFVLGAAVGAAAVVLSRARAVGALRAEAAAARETLARREADLENERKSSAERKEQVDRLDARFREAFAALSAEALRSNNETFLQLARQSLERYQQSAQDDLAGRQKAIGDLVAPVREILSQAETKLQSIEKEREGAYRALRQQVETMASTQERLKAETANLVQALRAPSVRGRWGEIHLRRVVELAGLIEHCDFEEQTSVETDDGRLRPDLVVHLPGGKEVIVDAKVPLKAYLEAQDTADEPARRLKLVEYSRQVREHIVRLGAKSYWDQFQDAPDFVVMYVPGEAFFSAALEAEPTLNEFGFSRKVILASPANLIAILKSVYYGWQQEKVRENAQKIRDLGVELFDRLRVMAEHLDNAGKNLGRAVDAFNEAAGSFEHRVLVSARRFRDLGAASSKEIPEIEPVGRTVRALAPPEDAVPAEPEP